jgi:cation diffusion facilitator family transporter
MNSKSNNPNIKFKVQRIIALFSILIFGGKLTAYFLTNSVGILTDALESTVNVVTGIISLWAIYISLKPRDKNHPFGHGKIEFLSASLEGFLIILAGLIIIFEAVKRLFSPAEVDQLDTGIFIVAGAGLLNYLVGWYSIRVGKKNQSIALISGGKHLQSDTYSSIGLVIGLILLYFTKLAWLDSAIALIFGTIIIITGYKILKETTANLMDEADFELIEKICVILEQNKTENRIDVHNLKLTKYGSSYHINCDMVLPWYMNLSQSHDEGNSIKQLLETNFSDDIVFHVHTDDCRKSYCKHCKITDCSSRRDVFQSEIPLKTDNIIREVSESTSEMNHQ